ALRPCASTGRAGSIRSSLRRCGRSMPGSPGSALSGSTSWKPSPPRSPGASAAEVPDPPAPTPFRSRACGGAVPDAEGPTPKADSRRWPNASTPAKTVMPPEADGRRSEEVCQNLKLARARMGSDPAGLTPWHNLSVVRLRRRAGLLAEKLTIPPARIVRAEHLQDLLRVQPSGRSHEAEVGL